MKSTSIRSVLRITTALGLVLVVSACANWSTNEARPRPAYDLENQDERAAMLLDYCDKLHNSGDLYMAASICQRASETKPTDPAPLYTLAEIYKKLEAPEQAANAYRAALMINPEDFEALYGLAKIAIDTGNYEVAEAQLERALQINENDPRVYNAMGIVKDQKGEHAVAQALYRTGLLIDPDNVSLRNNLGLSLALSGDQAESIALLRGVAQEPRAGNVGGKNLAHAATYTAPPEVMAERDTADGPIEIRPATPDGGPTSGMEFAEGDELATAMSKPLHKPGAKVASEPGMAADTGATDMSSGPRSIGSAGGQVVSGAAPQQDLAARIGPEPTKYERDPAEPTSGQTAAMPATESDYLIQVGAYGSEKQAERAWKTVLASAEGLLDGLSREVVRADLGGDKGVVYRLRAGPLPDQAASEKLCGDLKGRGVGCFVVVPPKTGAKTAAKPAAKPATEITAEPRVEPEAMPKATKAPEPLTGDTKAEQPMPENPEG
jgi:Flp pilus assembly protein TadD